MNFYEALFRKWQVPIIILVNLPVIGGVIRRALWIDKDGRVIKITPDAVHFRIGENKYRAVISNNRYADGLRQSFYLILSVIHEWDIRIANRLAPALNFGLDTLNQESDANNTMIRGSGGTYAAARSTSLDFFTNSASSIARRLGQIPIYFVYRILLMFDTSSISSGATITQVNMQLTAQTNLSTTDFNVEITKLDWSANDPVTSGNREANYDAALAATVDVTWRSTSGIATNTTYTSPNMDIAWVVKGGNTYYGLISSRDQGNIAPTNNELLEMHLQQAATAAYRPTLVIDYTAGGDGGGFFAYF